MRKGSGEGAEGWEAEEIMSNDQIKSLQIRLECFADPDTAGGLDRYVVAIACEDAADAIKHQAAEIAELKAADKRARDDHQSLVDWLLRERAAQNGIDGADLEAELLKRGILEAVEVTEPCGDACECAAIGEFPVTCYRPAKARSGE